MQQSFEVDSHYPYFTGEETKVKKNSNNWLVVTDTAKRKAWIGT